MFFKPRIFISSIMKGSLKKRDAIKKLLSECGAEVLLYEKNLPHQPIRTNIVGISFKLIL